LLPDEFNVLLGIKPDGAERIWILPFGAIFTLECMQMVEGEERKIQEVRFEIGNDRLTVPGAASYRAVRRNGISTVRSYPGMIAAGYFSTPGHSFSAGRTHRFFGECGNLFDSQRLGHLDTGQWLLCKGLMAGTVVAGHAHATPIAFKRGEDGRRGIAAWGHFIAEDEPSGFGRRGTIKLG
jgi:hypothetical protein